MSEERNQRAIYEGPERRQADRRKGERRSSNRRADESLFVKLLKVLIIVVVTASIMKVFKF